MTTTTTTTRQDPPANTGVLSVHEAASYLRISRAGLYRLIQAKKLKQIRIGGRTLIRKGDLEAFLDRCASAS